jgi:cell division protein FtsA
MVYKGGAVQHTAVLGLGGTHLTNDIATGLNTPANEAEKLKHRFGCAVASSVPQEERIEVPSVGGRGPRVLSRHILAEIIEPRVEEILTLVSKEISRAGVDGMLSSGIVLTGGTAGLQRIAALAERVFRLPIRVGMPTCPGNLADILRDPAYSTGVGLLQLAAEGSFEALNVPVADSVIARMRSRMGDWLREFF